MANYIRPKRPGASIFFTVALADRRSDLLVREVSTLRQAVAHTKSLHPFHIDAWVVLPDHIHAVWTLPANDFDFSTRWKDIKTRFTKTIGLTGLRSPSKISKGEAGIWQRRFWDHHIRNGDDFTKHVQYCWWNPVKHGLVKHATDWPYSSIHRDS